jgi:hypothetical protein
MCDKMKISPKQRDLISEITDQARDNGLSPKEAIHAFMCAAGLLCGFHTTNPNKAQDAFITATAVGFVLNITNPPDNTSIHTH